MSIIDCHKSEDYNKETGTGKCIVDFSAAECKYDGFVR